MTNVQVDGAHEGIPPSATLRGVMRGEIIPLDSRRSLEQLEADIRAVPLPDSGCEPLFTNPSEESYDQASMGLAHCYLVLLEGDNPPPIESDAVFSEEEIRQALERNGAEWTATEMSEALGSLVGSPKGPDYDLFSAVKIRWPNHADYFGGISGFMSGWAINAVRAIKGYGAVENPALIAIDEEGTS